MTVKHLTYNDCMDIIHEETSDYPVNVVGLAKKLGLKVWLATWDPPLRGKIERRDDDFAGPSGYAIIVNENDDEKQRRFTIAHEIAHFVLHRDEIGDGISDDPLYRGMKDGNLEVEANKMALDILTPWPLVMLAIDNGINTVDSLAGRFDVSESTMAVRLGFPG